MAGTNGGSIFMLPYIFFTVTIGLTLLIGEMCMGRSVRAGAAGAFRRLGGPFTGIIGYISVLTGFLVLAFYSVVGGWCVYYMIQAFMGNGIINDPSMMRGAFESFASSDVAPVLSHLTFLGATALVVYFGVEKGIERVSKVLMPLLFFMMLILIVRGLMLPGAMKGVEFLFKPDLSAFTGESLLNAMGFAFFSLSVGSGSQMNYGSYLSDRVHLPSSVSWIVFLAILSAILGGLMIMPAVFAFGLYPVAGPGLTFVTMPAVFSKMPLGQLFAVMFYVCLVVAALTSSVSMLEACTALLTRQFNMRRTPAILLTVASCTVVGLASTLSFGVWSDVKFFNRTIFDILDYVTSNVGMPLSTFGIAIAAAWVAWPTMKRELTAARPVSESGLWFIRIMIGVVSPLFVLVVAGGSL